MRAPRSLAGFTLREIVIALVLLAVISAIVMPRMSNDALLLASQAEQVAGDIRYVQSLSMSAGQRYLFRALSASTYELEAQGGAQIKHPTGMPSPITLGSGITMAPTSFLVGFDGQGIPYSDVGVSTALASNSTLTLTLNAATRTIAVSPETGRVIVQ